MNKHISPASKNLNHYLRIYIYTSGGDFSLLAQFKIYVIHNILCERHLPFLDWQFAVLSKLKTHENDPYVTC